ncbi:putative OmpA/MotB domain-containing protein [Megalodesulfovibrio gigas DSM 1382 = ATCC 19364]|uniref:Putative OmpA/MotB domain-containing protein n=1 Tax=Megalodesulfovibrio gigas (strain ATCC 19364 / DSM 1382 / NCIMB 9332 / VKM B-1759) TaxID=1121448 RepID=T2GC34_MEGG1|nr:putative OmpA/MotB domain-containing protein [Megalodesulfovibrio gigas DSM 1382 = ATCC 19364]
MTKEQLAAMEATLNQAKHQRQQLADKLAALAEIKRGMEDALHSASNTQAEMDEIESALAESELQISRFLRDRDTYHSQLSALDERLYSLQDDIRQALTTAESTLLGGPQPDAQGRARSLVAALGDGAFAPGKAVLQDAVKPQVAKALAALLQNQGARVSVEGHTDDSPLSGPAKDQYGDNINLSYHRAKAVADALVEGGLPPAAVVVAAHGASRPSHPNDTLEGRSRNRRVEIWLVTQ